MPLVPALLANDLESRWLGGTAASNVESGDRFATAVATWFAGAMASTFPCATAMARKSQLAAAAAQALSARQAPAAGAALAGALGTYMAGQSFGAGVAGPPVALPAAVSAIGAVFADLDAAVPARAQRIAQAAHLLALSTIVVFPTPLPPAPVM
jgi:hypothetical protein